MRRRLWRARKRAQSTCYRLCIRLRRKSELQRGWESGDPIRVARVTAVADAIIAQIRADEHGTEQ
jgi:hypothetical protein